MSDTSEKTDTLNVNPQPPIPSTPDELAAMEALYKNTKATDNSATSVAPWLLEEFTTHKNRLIKGQSKNNLSKIITNSLINFKTQPPRTITYTQSILTGLSAPLKMMELSHPSSMI